MSPELLHFISDYKRIHMSPQPPLDLIIRGFTCHLNILYFRSDYKRIYFRSDYKRIHMSPELLHFISDYKRIHMSPEPPLDLIIRGFTCHLNILYFGSDYKRIHMSPGPPSL